MKRECPKCGSTMYASREHTGPQSIKCYQCLTIYTTDHGLISSGKMQHIPSLDDDYKSRCEYATLPPYRKRKVQFYKSIY